MVVIALDIGGSKIVAALVDPSYKLLHITRANTPHAKGKRGMVELIEKIITHLLEKAEKKVSAIGISLPGFVDERGKILFAGNILSFLVGTPLQEILEEKFSLPVRIDNDALCFTLAESLFGAGKSYHTVLGIIWGSGLGSGLVIKPVNGCAPLLMDSLMELGHIPIYNAQARRLSTLEHLTGGHFILKRYQQRGGELRHINISELNQSRHPIARQIMAETIDYFAQGLATAVNILHPEVVVLGGGVSQVPDSIYSRIERKLKHYALQTHTKHLKLKRYAISNDAGLLGAAALVLKK